jgi:hypothetical protein
MSKKTLEHFRASMWWNPLTVDTLTLRSPLTPAECTQRMHAHTYQSPWGPAYGQELDPDLLFAGMVGDNLFMLAMMFAIVYPFYVFSTLLSLKEQEFLVESVAQLLEASDYPEGYVPSTLPSYLYTPLPARVAGSGGGAAASVMSAIIWAIAWLLQQRHFPRGQRVWKMLPGTETYVGGYGRVAE